MVVCALLMRRIVYISLSLLALPGFRGCNLGVAMDGRIRPQGTFYEAARRLDHASAQQSTRFLVHSDWEAMGLVSFADGVLEQREICHAFNEAPYTPIVWASAVTMFNGKLHVDPLFLADAIALRAMGVPPKSHLSIPVHSKSPQEVWAVSRSSRIAVFGRPERIRMDEGGETANRSRTDSRTGRRIKFQFQGVGARAPFAP